MSKRSQTDSTSRGHKDAELWQRFSPPHREREYDLHNPETLNALAAYAEGRTDDRGREFIEQRLLDSDAAIDDLAFLREMASSTSMSVPQQVEERARSLVSLKPQESGPDKGRFSWWGEVIGVSPGQLVAGRAWFFGLSLTGLLCFSLAGFQFGVEAQRLQVEIDQLLISDLSISLNSGFDAVMVLPGGGR